MCVGWSSDFLGIFKQFDMATASKASSGCCPQCGHSVVDSCSSPLNPLHGYRNITEYCGWMCTVAVHIHPQVYYGEAFTGLLLYVGAFGRQAQPASRISKSKSTDNLLDLCTGTVVLNCSSQKSTVLRCHLRVVSAQLPSACLLGQVPDSLVPTSHSQTVLAPWKISSTPIKYTGSVIGTYVELIAAVDFLQSIQRRNFPHQRASPSKSVSTKPKLKLRRVERNQQAMRRLIRRSSRFSSSQWISVLPKTKIGQSIRRFRGTCWRGTQKCKNRMASTNAQTPPVRSVIRCSKTWIADSTENTVT